jgi:hypothetical protein
VGRFQPAQLLNKTINVAAAVNAGQGLLKMYHMENIKKIRRVSTGIFDHGPAADKLKQILEICEANAVYDWDSNMENNPQDEFKAIAKIIKE